MCNCIRIIYISQRCFSSYNKLRSIMDKITKQCLDLLAYTHFMYFIYKFSTMFLFLNLQLCYIFFIFKLHLGIRTCDLIVALKMIQVPTLCQLKIYNFDIENISYSAEKGMPLMIMMMIMMKRIVYVVWLTNKRHSSLIPCRTIVRDPHHSESSTDREQDLNLRRTRVQTLLSEVVQQ